MVVLDFKTTGLLFFIDFFDVELQLNTSKRKFMATKTNMIRVIFNNISLGLNYVQNTINMA
jgi:hypothetical protein